MAPMQWLAVTRDERAARRSSAHARWRHPLAVTALLSVVISAGGAAQSSPARPFARTIRGLVTTAAGEPVANAGIRATFYATACARPDVRPGRQWAAASSDLPSQTDADGMYHLVVPSLGAYTGCLVVHVDPPAGRGLDAAAHPVSGVAFGPDAPADSVRADVIVPRLDPLEPDPGAIPFHAVSAGATHTCALTEDGAAWCWGADDAGQLGAPTRDTCAVPGGTTACGREPVPVVGDLRFVQISAGDRTTCGVSHDGRVACWGRAVGDSASDGAPARRAGPAPLATALRFREVHVGTSLACGLTTAGEAACWGAAPFWRDEPTVVSRELRFERLTVGRTHACASNREAAWCWGEGEYGVFGNGTDAPVASRTPVRVSPPALNLIPGPWFIQLAAGDGFTCAMRGVTAEDTYPPGDVESGLVHCWGRSTDGLQITGEVTPPASTPPPCAAGDSTVACTAIPTWVVHSVTTTLAAGYEHACVVVLQVQWAQCWGGSDPDQPILGAGRAVHRDAWQRARVEGRLPWTAITVGRAHACGIAGGSVYCWGENDVGQLGDRTTATRWRPVRVAGSR